MPRYLKTQEEFDQALKEAGDKWVVVDFTASWCGPCKMIAPVFEEMSKKYTNVCFYKVDVDENEETARTQKISAMPTFKFFRNGVEVPGKGFMGGDQAMLKQRLEEISS